MIIIFRLDTMTSILVVAKNGAVPTISTSAVQCKWFMSEKIPSINMQLRAKDKPNLLLLSRINAFHNKYSTARYV